MCCMSIKMLTLNFHKNVCNYMTDISNDFRDTQYVLILLCYYVYYASVNWIK